MDLPRPALVSQTNLRLSAEGRRLSYLAQDQGSGRIFTLPRRLALALHRLLALRDGNPAARDLISEEDGREVQGFLGLMQHMRQQETLVRKPFNPVFMGIPLFEVAPWQPALAGLARALVRPAFLAFMALLLLASVFLGLQSDWAILAVFRNVFSLEALLTFGLIAPLLKILHELGHVLVATRYKVPVRNAGLFLIGLYPMPFVDLSEADMTAPRGVRITISLAGLAVDITVGLIAFIAWHFTAGSYLQVLLGNIFVFSALNSLLFNGNPLIKLDGYFALVDAIGQRNLYSRASTTLRDSREALFTLGRAGQRPRGAAWGLLIYGILAFLYRLNILIVIAAALLPRHLGLGAVVVGWGAYVMFASPLLNDKPGPRQRPQAKAQPSAPGGTGADGGDPEGGLSWRRWLVRLTVLAGLSAALVFVEAPFRTVVPVALDVREDYTLTSPAAGFLTAPLRTRHVNAGEVLLRLDNPGLLEEIALMQADLAGAEAAYATVQGSDPAQAEIAREQVDSFAERLAVLRAEQAALEVTAESDALFLPQASQLGRYLRPGEPIGVLLPDAEDAALTGAFPERFVRLYQDALMDLELRIAGRFEPVPPEDVTLVAIPGLDPESGRRSYVLHLRLETGPQTLMGQPADLKLRFQAEPLWRHVVFFGEGLLARYRDNLLVDRAGYLGEAP